MNDNRFQQLELPSVMVSAIESLALPLLTETIQTSLGKTVMWDPRKILIASPEPSAGQELLERFSAQGYQTVAVERGGDALLAVAEENIGLVVLDISIQEPSGAKTVEILRKIRPRLPVIVLSGDSSVEMGRQILQHGVLYYFLKPLNFEELDQIVRIALEPGRHIKPEVNQGVPGSQMGEEKGAAM